MEQWLDENALKLLNKPSDDLDNDDSDIKETINPFISYPKSYDSSKLSIKLPYSEKKEQLEFIPPKLNSDAKISHNTIPQFQIPDPSFDVFEHFHIKWISVPEFESGSGSKA